ncbi:hypothetical protein LWC34_38640 [Kibdelosporangium philippinense]|uniref:Hemerythrin-like domain-containing protein n=1 Tax=Kibdelosporangium philippinense TaxID=211113 RepID=A0ABS8ZLV0_9PSEU|nr:hypothetical protein [Kibdelosporangium philippinense]MCE7008690.1 hypothetical protein [Kibdelosporangium philippinense]
MTGVHVRASFRRPARHQRFSAGSRATPHGMAAYFDGREMAMVHRMFRREFLLAAGLVINTTRKDRAELVADHIASVTTSSHHHHHMEDSRIWPMLEQRCPDNIRPREWLSVF